MPWCGARRKDFSRDFFGYFSRARFLHRKCIVVHSRLHISTGRATTPVDNVGAGVRDARPGLGRGAHGGDPGETNPGKAKGPRKYELQGPFC